MMSSFVIIVFSNLRCPVCMHYMYVCMQCRFFFPYVYVGYTYVRMVLTVLCSKSSLWPCAFICVVTQSWQNNMHIHVHELCTPCVCVQLMTMHMYVLPCVGECSYTQLHHIPGKYSLQEKFSVDKGSCKE